MGRSLGINNIPPKVCTYACIYCQLGCTINMPHKTLQLASILNGMLEFANVYKEELVTETMLVKDVNGDEDLYGWLPIFWLS
ncbi:MAG: hypothetical protein HBSAPP01_00020 [Candidatus Brocadia sapporoensis]|nr:MAG: hypothetical protein HBSAPP01_00020 [Candidatus Brocadia sapporoensis]